MTKEEALKLLKGGPDGIAEWNQRRLKSSEETGELEWFNLDGVDLSNGDLRNVNLTYVSLKKADLHKAKLNGVKFRMTTHTIGNTKNYQGVHLQKANLDETEWYGEEELNETTIGLNLFHDIRSLENVSFKKAKLSGVTFYGLTLKGADFRGAELENAKFEVNLSQVNFRNANLKGVNFSKSTNLSAHQLGGADLTGAIPPEAIREFGALKTVEIQSGYLRKLFVTLVAACIFCCLTIANTTDVELLTNRASTPIPIIGGNIPIVGFFIVGAILLLCFFVFFLLNVQRNFETLSELPAFFWDGQPLHKRAFPWLTNGLVLWFYPRLKIVRPAFWRLQISASILIVWGLVPAVLTYFLWRFLPRHDWSWTICLMVIVTISYFFSLNFLLQALFTLRGKDSTHELTSSNTKAKFWARVCFIAALIVTVPLGLKLRDLAISAIDKGDRPANFEEQDVSEKPNGWTNSDDQLKLVRGANLQGRDLRQLRAKRAFLVNADFRGADLRVAGLSGANLIGAKLQGANLEWADLSDAVLRGTNLSGARLLRANLIGANLYNVDLSFADLRKVKLARIYNWESIKSLNHANINNIENPPDGFIDWAKKNGAVEIPADVEWQKYKASKFVETNKKASMQKAVK